MQRRRTIVAVTRQVNLVSRDDARKADAEESLVYQSIKDVHTMNPYPLTVEIGDQIESKLLLSPHILQFVPEWE
jgi:hypothetical protein